MRARLAAPTVVFMLSLAGSSHPIGWTAPIRVGHGAGAPQETPKQEPATPAKTDAPAPPQESAPAEKKQPENPLQKTPATILAEKPVTQEQLQALVQRAVTNDLENYEAYKNLTHAERIETDQFDSKGNPKKSESVTQEVFILYGERVEHVIARNDKPLSADDAKKEQEKFDKQVAKLKGESAEKRQKREEKFQEQTRKDRESIADAAGAFNFTLLGEEMVNGRPAYVIQGEQKPDYKPNTKAGEILRKVHGKIWIDIAATHWVKLDVEFTDTYSFGWVLARVRKGTRVQVEQVLFRDDVWVPRVVDIKLDARVALFKQYFANIDMTYRDWRQFSSDSKITGFAEIEQPKQQPAEQQSPAQPAQSTPPPQ